MDISGEKKARYTGDEHGASNLNVDGLEAEGYEMDKQRLRMYVGGYITNAKGYLKNVCNGVFPKIDRKQRRHVGRKQAQLGITRHFFKKLKINGV